MSYKRSNPHHAALEQRIERRFRINKNQSDFLDELAAKYDIPASALVRLSLSCLIPKFSNMEVTEEGILNLWDREKF